MSYQLILVSSTSTVDDLTYLERVEASKRYHKASSNFTGKYLNLPSVQKILGELSEGQRNTGARIAAIAITYLSSGIFYITHGRPKVS